jgi:hypothetical protein
MPASPVPIPRLGASRNGWRWRRLAVIAGWALASAGSAGCAAAAGSGPSRAAGVAAGSASSPAAGMPTPCSSHAPAKLSAPRLGPARVQLAPAGVQAIRLCRYSGLNARPRLNLIGARLVQSPSVIGGLVRDLDRLPPFSGPIACPADDGSQIVLWLTYPSGHRVAVSVGLTGCDSVTNGSVVRMGLGSVGAGLIDRLKRLVPLHRRSRPETGAALARGRWSILAASPLGPRSGATFVWDGHELLELGGSAGIRSGGSPRFSGAAYAPATGRWRRVASAPTAVQTAGAASLWTGRQVFLFGGLARPGMPGADVAGLYDPATNRWSVSRRAPVGPFASARAVWTGRRVIVAGVRVGVRVGARRLEVAAYDPATGLWSALDPPLPATHPAQDAEMVATPDGVLIWSLWSAPPGGAGYGIDAFRLTGGGSWSDETGSWPQAHTVDQPIFTGREILLAPGQIWCGLCSHPAPHGEHSPEVDPTTLHITPIPHGPLDDLGPQIAWSGAAEIALNAGGEMTGPRLNVRPGAIAVWDPDSGRWSRGRRAPLPIGDAPPVWSAGRLYVLGQGGRLLAYGG